MNDEGLRRLRRQLGEHDATPPAWRNARDRVQTPSSMPPATPPVQPARSVPQNGGRSIETPASRVSGSFHLPLAILVILHLLAITLLGAPEVLRIPYVSNIFQQFSMLYEVNYSELMLGRIMPAPRLWLCFGLAVLWALVPQVSAKLPWVVLVSPGILLTLSLLLLVFPGIRDGVTDNIGSLSVTAILIMLIMGDILKLKSHTIRNVNFSSAITSWLWWVIVVFPVTIGLGRLIRDSLIPAKVRRGDDLEDLLNFGNLAFHWGAGVTWVVVIWSALKILTPPYSTKNLMRLIVIMSAALIFYFSVFVNLVSHIQF